MSKQNIVAKNQFGEQQNLSIFGGSAEMSCNFVVDSANGNGLGIRSLKTTSPDAISAVYMHTSASPATGNPEPAVGYIVVQFARGYKGYVSGAYGFVAPLSGSAVNVTSGLTQYAIYVIASLGTTSAAAWQALGLPTNVTPTVGQAFVAATASAGTGTGVVELAASAGSGIQSLEVIGDPNQSIAANTGGGYMILACYAATNSGTTTRIATAPADGSVVGLTFVMQPTAQPLI